MRYTRAQALNNRLRNIGYSHQELADELGYTRSYITQVLNGKRAPDAMRKIAGQIHHWEVLEENERRRRHGKG